MNSFKNMKFTIDKLSAKYNSSFHFKVKIGNKTTNESVETKGTYKYEKGTNETVINETVILNLNTAPVGKDAKIHAYLQVYTKTGYKTAGAGEILISSLKAGSILNVEIVKCPLGQGSIVIQYNNSQEAKDDNKEMIEELTKKNKEMEEKVKEAEKYKEQNTALLQQVNELKQKLEEKSAIKPILTQDLNTSTSKVNSQIKEK